MKKITINPGRRLSVSSIVVGYLQENKAEQIAFEIPEEFKDYGRKACFEANGETFAKTFDNVTGDTLTFTRDMPLSYNEVTNIFTDSDLLPKINAKYYRNFVTTIQNLQVNEKALKQELADINTRLTALETAQTNVVESEEEANDIQVQ